MNICSISGKAALFGRVPYCCTRVTVWAVDGDMALVHALTAWFDTGWDGPAWRVVPVETLSHFSDGWGSIGPARAAARLRAGRAQSWRPDAARAADVARALGTGWSAPFRKRTSP